MVTYYTAYLMKDLYRNKYRVSSARLKNWDYGANAAYFITICTQNHSCFFGEITNGIMRLNSAGLLAERCWLEIPERFPHIELGDFVIMPNHMHGILIVDKPVEARLIAPLRPSGGITAAKNPMVNDSISRIIRWYKGKCTFLIRQSNPYFSWQHRFYDHIIRNAGAFERIQQYIVNNPMRWENDKFHLR